MMDASGVQGRKNSMCSVCTSGWFRWASVLVKCAWAADASIAATQPPRSTGMSGKYDVQWSEGEDGLESTRA
jgi:hypothetical protein